MPILVFIIGLVMVFLGMIPVYKGWDLAPLMVYPVGGGLLIMLMSFLSFFYPDLKF